MSQPESSDAPHPPADDPYERVPDAFRVIHRHGLGQRGLASQRAFQPGDVLAAFTASRIHKHPHRMTVQVSEREHIELAPRYLELVNHGCAPNVAFDTERFALIALRPIAPSDELTFFYPSTEWFMADPFECRCGHADCLGEIRGASQLALTTLKHHHLGAHIVRLLASKHSDAGQRTAAVA
jgi:hypothetical protein